METKSKKLLKQEKYLESLAIIMEGRLICLHNFIL